MSATFLFVHGTGVREGGYSSTLRLIAQGLERHAVPADVHGCFWGKAEGARWRGGKSVPGYDEAGGMAPTERDQELAVWSMLYTDPWYELRLLRHMPVSGPAPFGQEPPAIKLRRAVLDFVPSPALVEALRAAGLEGRFEAALADLRAAPELAQAAATAPADPLEHRRAIARAVVAQTLLSTEDAGEPVPDGATRDALVVLLTDELHGYGLGVGEFLLSPVKGFAARIVTRKLTGDRGAISDAAYPMAGDILRFLARGDGVRRFIREAVTDLAPGPVYLLGHSLGGIMCVDLLAREPLPQVAGLVTIGSQSSFLYEIGALPAIEYPAPLPDHFPAWLNIYDRRDVLSYLAADVLGGQVEDVEVDNGQPFPQSHSAYWSNAAVWDAIAAFLR